jgi:hypothetical protein
LVNINWNSVAIHFPVAWNWNTAPRSHVITFSVKALRFVGRLLNPVEFPSAIDTLIVWRLSVFKIIDSVLILIRNYISTWRNFIDSIH